MEKQKKAQRPEEVRARIKQLIQQTMQEALEGELDDFLGYPKHGKSPSDNNRNGHSEKTVQTDTGPIDLKVPRDRDSEFEPQLVKKRQTVLDDLEEKIVALYAKGMTTRDIQDILGDMYGTALSPSLISRLTDRVLPRLEEWQNRPLKGIYPILWFDCIFYAVRDEGKVQQKAIYVVIGLGLDGRKELLGFWVDKTESKGFWLGVLNDLKSRGLRESSSSVSMVSPASRTLYGPLIRRQTSSVVSCTRSAIPSSTSRGRIARSLPTTSKLSTGPKRFRKPSPRWTASRSAG